MNLEPVVRDLGMQVANLTISLAIANARIAEFENQAGPPGVTEDAQSENE